ncbi:hypothetical protein DMN91_004510 [Ooceraea biroi]|uniref:F-box only protein n=1 Tax=Ooceraea biroi TaxID=2015173 RepID=A0A026WBK2_OOCBI|nr:F-box only protein 21 [Ooceraea biroi]EZA53435.1 F-box only protein [Ooceraea biroi]RLU22232.1 hypothetical protein DMN91_004510 [Ooceraea biroi]
MATIMCLSEDVIIHILRTNDIGIRDVVNFSSTCKHFRDMIENSNSCWRWKSYQRWPSLEKAFPKRQDVKNINFKELTKAGVKCMKELRHFLTEMNKKYYRHIYYERLEDTVSLRMRYDNNNHVNVNEEDIHLLIHPDEAAHPLNYYFLIDELTSLLKRSEESGYMDDLTNLYYGEKLLPYLKHYHLKEEWKEFINRPVEQQLLEEAATFFSQWYQPNKDISYSRIQKELNNITEQVMQQIRIEHPTHPIFSASHEQLSFWKNNNIDENQWNNEAGRQILDVLCKTLFQLSFQGLGEQAYRSRTFRREHVLIDHVLQERTGYIVSLAVVFQSVARRLGLRCDLISFPDHCFLTWKPNYNTNPDYEHCFYIDILNNGALLSKNDCPRIRGATKCPIKNFNTYSKINSIQLVLKLITCIELTDLFDQPKDIKERKGWLLELRHFIKPDDMDAITDLSYYYMDRKKSLSSLITSLQKNYYSVGFEEARRQFLLDKLQRNEEAISKFYKKSKLVRKHPKRRLSGMKFAVGMIVRTNLDTEGVITGWNPKKPNFRIRNTISSVSWYYAVLCEDERLYYISEVGLCKVNRPKPFNNSSFGKYFCRFEDNHYVPNELLANDYPFDISYLSNKS